MTKVVLDETLKAKIGDLTQEVEICDETGRTIGHCLPAEDYRRLFYAWLGAQLDAEITPEELERRRQEPGGRTLAEIWKDLGRT